MAKNVIMPKFGMDQEEGTVARWFKAEGEAVVKGEPLLEVETDKVNMEVEAPASGVLAQVTAGPGVTVPIGQTIAVLLAPGEAARVASPPAHDERPRATPPATPVAANVAREHGVALEAVPAGGPRIMRRDVEQYVAAQQSPAQQSPAQQGALQQGAVPAARRLARVQGVDLAAVAGSGPGGRIQSRDVERAAQTAQTMQTVEALPAAPSAPAAASTDGRALRRIVPLTPTRRTIARRMVASVQEAPQFAVDVQAHMARALDALEQHRAAGQEGPRVTLTALLVRVCAAALGRHPQVNASFLPEGIAEWADANIGVAVAAEEGLVVPVLAQAQRLTLAEIAQRLDALAQRARTGKLTPADVQGGTFTLSNLGMFGADGFTALLNPPQAAILAVGRVAQQPWVNDAGELQAAPLLRLTLTADHRVIDGALAARFLGTIKRLLEAPALLL